MRQTVGVIKRAQRSHATRDLQLPPNGLLHVLSLRPALSSKPKLKPALNSKLTLHTGAVHALSLPFLKAVLKELKCCWKARDQNSLPHLATVSLIRKKALTPALPCISYYKQNKLYRLVCDDSRQLEWSGPHKDWSLVN